MYAVLYGTDQVGHTKAAVHGPIDSVLSLCSRALFAQFAPTSYTTLGDPYADRPKYKLPRYKDKQVGLRPPVFSGQFCGAVAPKEPLLWSPLPHKMIPTMP